MIPPIDDQFLNRAESLIRVANQQIPLFGVDNANLSFLYAASRFNAWHLMQSAASKADFEANADKHIAELVQVYSDFLKSNMRDYTTNFE